MWTALFGSQEKGTLVLKAHPSAAHVNGFRNGGELRIAVDRSGQPLGELLDKFNTYRGPDQQIKKVWDMEGASLSLTTPVHGLFYAIVKGESIT